MKKIYIYLLVTICILGFKENKNHDKTSIKSAPKSSISIDNVSEIKNTIPETNYPTADTIISDTILTDSFRIIIEPLKKEDFISLHQKSGLKDYPTGSDPEIIENLNDKASRLDDSTLIINLSSGIVDTISNYSYSKYKYACAQYKYIDYVDEIKSHLLVGMYYENFIYVLVDDGTGEMNRQILSSAVSIDSSKKRLVTYYWDEWAYESGGFEIFDISNGKMDRILTYHQKNPEKDGYYWSLSNVFYLSPTELIYVHQLYFIKSQQEKKAYARMTIERTTSN